MTEPGKPEKYDIFISIIVMNGAYTGKKSQVRKSIKFDSGSYDITTLPNVEVLSMYQKFEDQKPNHNILYPPFLFRLRNIGRIPHCFFDMTTEHYQGVCLSFTNQDS